MHVWRSPDGSEVAVLAATWEVHHKVTFESLEPEFRANPAKAWRNYGSLVSYNLEAALPPGAIQAAQNPAHESPFDIARDKFFEWFRGLAGRRYFLHYDLSVRRDATGIALVHREYDGSIVVDWMYRHVIPEGTTINFAKMREYAYQLTAKGFAIEEITYDQFQSEETRQVLEEKGYHTDRESADKNTVAYDTLVELVLTTAPGNRRIDYYPYPPFLQEMEELKRVNGIKYDHPKKNKHGGPGSKDVADAVACATKRAIIWHLENGMEAPGMVRVHRNESLARAARSYGD
jgi:hypothetical protein